MFAAVVIMSTLIIGHRGASGYVPENTMPAFEKALEMGADGIELDLWPSADGTPMVIHDESLERTYGRQGVVAAWETTALQGLGVPAYQQLLEHQPGTYHIFTELKGGQEDKVAHAIMRAVESGAWRYEQLPVIGFDHKQLQRLKRRFPVLHIGATFSQDMLQEVPVAEHGAYMVEKAQRVGAYAINPDYRLVTAEVVRQAKAAGLKVNVWTVNTPQAMDAMLALEVDAVMTDYPDVLYRKIHGKDALPHHE